MCDEYFSEEYTNGTFCKKKNKKMNEGQTLTQDYQWWPGELLHSGDYFVRI